MSNAHLEPQPAIEMLKERSAEAADYLRLLSNPTRLLILCHLVPKERSVAELERDLGIRQPGLSQQLAELRENGLVRTRRESRSIFYDLADDRTRAFLAFLHRAFCEAPETLQDLSATHPAKAPATIDGAASFGKILR